MFSKRNEQQTRFELIDPALDARGWLRSDIKVEQTAAQIDIIDGKPVRRVAGRTDYLLRRPMADGAEPTPLAIIEAKREGLPPEHGLQQGKDYRVGELNHVPFVFSSNGHLFVEYDEATGQTSEPKPLTEFPRPEELVARYLQSRQLPAAPAALTLLTTSYAKGRDFLRYYQDAAIRAALEKIITDRAAGKAPRVLLSLATGAGKTRIAAALLKRMFDAGGFGTALFVCDRTELRDNGEGDFLSLFGTDAATADTRHPHKNAKVIIATYQTLDYKFQKKGRATKGEPKQAVENFFTKHYPANYFDVIVIDECHRSAWGDWFDFLRANSNGIHIGLTATPREIEPPKTNDAETKKQIEDDRLRLADNKKYFGDPVYVYSYLQGVRDGYLAPATIEQYDLYHDWQEQPERVRGVLRADLAGKQLTNALTGQPVGPAVVAERNEGSALESKLILPDRVTAMCGHLFGRLLANGDQNPQQKTIIYCASDHHADLVANELNGLYANWCKTTGQRRLPHYAFKCMASNDGQKIIADLRGSQKRNFIATTMDLLTTGVNVPCVRNIVFFRYIRSPILFSQIVGRGTRLDPVNDKLMFRIYDYTGATELFGEPFITRPPTGGGGGEGPGGDDPPPPIKAKGITVKPVPVGNFHVIQRNGQPVRVSAEEYRQAIVNELLATVPTLAGFREKWLDPDERRALLDQLRAQNLLPENLRTDGPGEEYDLFDVIAAVAYGVKPRTRGERAARLDGQAPDWFKQLPPPAANVIRAIARQFERAGTEALETDQLWSAGEVRA
ncbi:MAG TPA: DEAD/DEAH box helicase family protein, partial [Verrucomicrobiae bacterium]